MTPKPHQHFVEKVKRLLEHDPRFFGLAAAGSWSHDELDEFSDLNLILVGEALNAAEMDELAGRLGHRLASFPADHRGEPRQLVCLFEDPLLHVDLKFQTAEELRTRTENPAVIWERNGEVTRILEETKPHPEHSDLQWMEDRVWTWIHYAAQKLGRGELFEVLDTLAFLRARVLGPLLSQQAGRPALGVRRLEKLATVEELAELKSTIAAYETASCELALKNTAKMYLGLRETLAPLTLRRNRRAEMACLRYLHEVSEQRARP